MPEFVFTSFLKENRPLSAELWRRARPLLNRITTATSLEDLEAFQPTLVAAAVAELGIKPPRLGRIRKASDREGETKWDATRTAGSPTRRFYVAVEVSGDITLISCWPDLAGAELKPVDAEVVAELGGLDATTRASNEEVSRYLRAGQVWEIDADDDPRDGRPATFSLYTYFELTLQDEDAVARGDLDLAGVVRERRERITPIVVAIEEQVQLFLTRDLPDRLSEMAEDKRMELSNRQAVRDSLSFPEDWLGREPELDDAPLGDPLPPAQREREPLSAQPEDMHLNPRSRLSRATFDDVLFSIRHWANAVERYPAAFGVLVEDRISTYSPRPGTRHPPAPRVRCTPAAASQISSSRRMCWTQVEGRPPCSSVRPSGPLRTG